MTLHLFDTPDPTYSAFDPTICRAETITHGQAARIVAEAHYIGRLGSTSLAIGLRMGDRLAGVICFGTVPRNNASAICGPELSAEVLELTRLALYDWAPRNSESWLIGQAFARLTVSRPDISILISYADASVGHVGTIYQATNWIYTGKTTGDVFYQCDDGTRIHPRTTGWNTTALPPGQWAPSPAKHRYVQFIGPPSRRRQRRKALLWPALPYPKTTEGERAA